MHSENSQPPLSTLKGELGQSVIEVEYLLVAQAPGELADTAVEALG